MAVPERQLLTLCVAPQRKATQELDARLAAELLKALSAQPAASCIHTRRRLSRHFRESVS